ncbi:hypothetical protein NBRGN_065_00440 [Nocardia brasiliensis NBRC 14402]|uniref:DUF3558 domain-containing protein n=1 Tax=Nocardia brasiliensis TaxID=37326 RepID=UPI00045D0D57|nr:DUF3558 domain-containing protein [Nocardia brasiliensis]ASF10904.1 DUF3558 domain-containing protein [Nocardia brasiliensis]GAJ83648.1 hypothetical protein NBRGN_065_00440 [Nocardia brasiliensis NBRC 14402]
MKRSVAAACCGVAVLLASACDSETSGGDPAESSAAPSSTQLKLAVSVPPAPAQRNQGRKDVTFDPCFKLDDVTIERAGYDPRTRRRKDFIADGYSALGCEFTRKEQGLLMGSLVTSSSNLTLDEYKNRYASSAATTSVAGREAVTYQLPGDSTNTTCFLAMKATDGVLQLQLDVNKARTADRPCDLIRSTAESIEPSLPRA